jgi:hypothetical protein
MTTNDSQGITLAPTLYLERVLTEDSVLWKYCGKGFKPKFPQHYDVIIKDVFGNIKRRIPWYHVGRPDKRNRYVRHNCSRYRIVWVN